MVTVKMLLRTEFNLGVIQNLFRKLCDLCLDCDKLHNEGGMEKEEEVENHTCREAEGNVSSL